MTETGFSGIQPTVELPPGHYLGAVRSGVELQNSYRRAAGAAPARPVANNAARARMRQRLGLWVAWPT